MVPLGAGDRSSSPYPACRRATRDQGLSWRSAVAVWDDALSDAATKSTQYGGSTGFWKQARRHHTLTIPGPTCLIRRISTGFWKQVAVT